MAHHEHPGLLQPANLTLGDRPRRFGPSAGAPADAGAEPQGDAPCGSSLGALKVRAARLRRPLTNRLASDTDRLTR